MNWYDIFFLHITNICIFILDLNARFNEISSWHIAQCETEYKMNFHKTIKENETVHVNVF